MIQPTSQPLQSKPQRGSRAPIFIGGYRGLRSSAASSWCWRCKCCLACWAPGSAWVSSTPTPIRRPTPAASAFGAAAWWVISSVIALGFGGYVSAWMAGIEVRKDGMLHGLITWGIATLLTIYLLSSAIGSIIGGGFSALGSTASAAGSSLKDAAQPLAQASGVSPDMVQQQAQAYLQPANTDPATMSPQDAQKQVASNLATYAKGGPDAPAAKEQVINIMAAQQHISHDDAAKRFDDAQAKLQQSRDQAVQAAKNAADASAAAASKTSFAAFGNLLLGAIVAAIGGSLAVQRRVNITHRTIR